MKHMVLAVPAAVATAIVLITVTVFSTVAVADTGYTPVAVAVYNDSVASPGQLQVLDTIVCGNYTIVVYGVDTAPLLSVAYAKPGMDAGGALQCLAGTSKKLGKQPLAIAAPSTATLQAARAHVEAVTVAEALVTVVKAVNVAGTAQGQNETIVHGDAGQQAAACTEPAREIGKEPTVAPIVVTTVAPLEHVGNGTCYAGEAVEVGHSTLDGAAQTVYQTQYSRAGAMGAAERTAITLLAGALAAAVVAALWRARA
ncbi:hypothetical protein [Pyrodictium abyssi]|uniref:Uncharacterized protein n=1 Tax=Pyrodictium abyssi TaxID=54256 RepID=A0ABM8IXC8_9CREN|nr:hypothetical protein PABY_17450 [Pyrodictium abyssi]